MFIVECKFPSDQHDNLTIGYLVVLFCLFLADIPGQKKTICTH